MIRRDLGDNFLVPSGTAPGPLLSASDEKETIAITMKNQIESKETILTVGP